MLARILGYVWIAAGLIFVLRPQMLKNSLRKKSLKRFKRFFISLALALGALLISAAWRYQGILAKVVVILGIASIFKGVFLVNSKAGEKMTEWFSKKPLIYFRLGGLLYLIIGIILILLH